MFKVHTNTNTNKHTHTHTHTLHMHVCTHIQTHNRFTGDSNGNKTLKPKLSYIAGFDISFFLPKPSFANSSFW